MTDTRRRSKSGATVPLPQNDLEKRIIEAFEVFDHAGNKTVDVREVGTVLRSLGCCPSEAEVQEIIINIEDTEAPGSVHLSQFLPYITSIISEYKLQGASTEDLLKAFQTLDKEKKGYLTKEQVSKLFTEQGEPFTQEELNEMMSVATDPDTHHINYEYYINQIMINVSPNIYSLVPKKVEEKPRDFRAILMGITKPQI